MLGSCSTRGGETETDTETAAILTKYVFGNTPNRDSESLTFTNIIGAVLKELEGSFALRLRDYSCRKWFPSSGRRQDGQEALC
jgi:glucosamine 6-phosphate synthetase-like amidotransferase/phosphosugar isomerase protein